MADAPMWTILPPLEADAATQMAIDAVLLDRCEADTDSAFLRFYRMNPSAVTIGRHQRWRRVIDPVACKECGWTWVRRPTGGGALLHADEVNYAIAFGCNALAGMGLFGFRSVFEWFAKGFAASFKRMGMNPEVSVGSRESASGEHRGSVAPHGLCGRSLTRYEITDGGRKLLASAQLLTASGVLQHGTVYMRAPVNSARFWPNTIPAKTLHRDPAEDLGISSPAKLLLSSNVAMPAHRWTDLAAVTQGLQWQEVAGQLAAGIVEVSGSMTVARALSESELGAVFALVERWRLRGWHTQR
jgi:lipoate-protein ligase A